MSHQPKTIAEIAKECEPEINRLFPIKTKQEWEQEPSKTGIPWTCSYVQWNFENTIRRAEFTRGYIFARQSKS